MIHHPTDRKYAKVPRPKVHPGENARKDIDRNSLQGLIDSLASIGQQVPLIVYSHPALDGEWVISDGHRRWEAMAFVPLHEVEVICLPEKPDDIQLLVVQLSLGS